MHFRSAFKYIFSLAAPDDGSIQPTGEIVDKAIDEIYDQVRCGLFHMGMICGHVRFSAECHHSFRIDLDSQAESKVQIQVNPHRVLDELEAHLSTYLSRLRKGNDGKLRSNFEKGWDIRAHSKKGKS